jgi:3-dehydroquinate synthase
MIVPINFPNAPQNDYSIYINELDSITIDSKVAIITNPKVAGLHLKTLLENIKAKELYIITVPDGEEYKNQQSIDNLLENLFNHKFDRSSTLIAFGGGVIGDMTGFLASIYQRGIKFIQIPTTLLSQVDASVGGKTGINNRYGKNLVGAFYQPKAVYIETAFLQTLPKREFGAGVAEIVKMAVTFDKDFFSFLENADLNKTEDLEKAIAKSVQTKAKVVELDEKENGIRAVLNYGHTFAHVIEHQTNYRVFLHGEAVGIGIVMANKLALKLGNITEDESSRIKNLLERYNIPTNYKIKDIEKFYEDFFLDKKTRDNSITFILPKGIGGYEIKKDIDKDILLDVLKEFA